METVAVLGIEVPLDPVNTTTARYFLQDLSFKRNSGREYSRFKGFS